MVLNLAVDDYLKWRSLPDVFFHRAEELADKPFLWAKQSKKWRPRSWNDVADETRGLALGLRDLGVLKSDRIVICADNSPEWFIAELAVMCIGAVPVPAYTTNTAEDHQHIIDNVEAKAAIVSGGKIANAASTAAANAPSCEMLITLEGLESDSFDGKLNIYSWEDVVQRGSALSDDIREVEAAANRDDTAVIIHTSGTGGVPKGVMLSHGAVLSNCMGGYDRLKDHIEPGSEVFLSFLPLSHAYEHMAGLWLPVSLGAEIYYAGSIDSLVGDMAEVQPTIMTAVPRLYEVMHMRVAKAMKDVKGLKKTLFDSALRIGRKRYETPQSLTLAEKILDRIVDPLVRKKIRGRFGGKLKFFVSGGAPLNYDIGMYFTSLGVKLIQGYGMTEAAPLISVNPADHTKIDTVGPPVSGVELKIAEDGEICVRGELVMQGYFRDDEATKVVIRDGWLCTGDIGVLDSDGHIVITDRKKDIIVNSGGDNISPQRIEGYLTLQPEIGQAMIYGDQKPHLVALLIPDPEDARSWARENGKPTELDQLAEDSAFRDYLGQAVERVNRDLSNIERVRRYVIRTEEFTTENEMLTPSLKIRRHIIRNEYGDALEALYGTGKKKPSAPASVSSDEKTAVAPRPATA